MPLPKLDSLRLPWPADWDAIFDQTPGRPLILEIGFGRGGFLFHLAQQHPDHNILGLEVANRSLEAVERAIERAGWPHVRVIYALAETALHHLLRPASVQQVHVNFPDPWFKRGHHHRRLMQRTTLDAIVSRLAPGGEFFLATDIRAYADLSAALLAATPGLDNQLPSAWADALPGRMVTKYEAKARAEGRPCYYFAYRRNAQPAPPVPVQEEWEMPHIVFASPLSIDALQAGFEPGTRSEDDLHVHFITCYRGRGTLLIETHINEPTLDQRIALMVLDRERYAGEAPDGLNEYTIQLSTLGHPRPTAGIHRAVAWLAAHFIALHPESRVVNRKVRDG